MKQLLILINLLIAIIIHQPLYPQIISEVSKLSPVKVCTIVYPSSLQELQALVLTSDAPLSLAGGRFSQGGQIAYPEGLVIDMTRFNQIISFDREQKQITVQPGIRWIDIQQKIDPYNLSINVMQSYNDFTVGGSLSVNVHGRSFYGPLIKTVKSIKVLLADGSITQADRNQNNDLFAAALGGYGLMGIIVEVTLLLTDNEKIERRTVTIPLKDYSHFFFTSIYNNHDVVFHNANLYPNDFNYVTSITWYKTNKPLTNQERLQKKHSLYIKEKCSEQLLRRFSIFKWIRQQVEPKQLAQEEIVWRNYEMSYSVQSLEPVIRFPTTSILQEYFIPITNLNEFVDRLRTTVQEHNINMLNVSIRYVPANTESILSYAPQDSFALVCYINVYRINNQKYEKIWTQCLIEHALNLQGTYYLPYHLYATSEQFIKAYPTYKEFIACKDKYDPHHKFKNLLYKKYLEPLLCQK